MNDLPDPVEPSSPNARTSPSFVQPVPPARREADAAQARENATVIRPDLAAARREAEKSPRERYADMRDGAARLTGQPISHERIGDRKLTDDEVAKLTFGERREYAARRTELQQDPARTDATTEDTSAAGEKIKVGDIELTEEEVRGLLARKGLEDSRKLTLPERPEDYKLELPKNFQTPQGIEFQFNENHPTQGPLLAQAKAFAYRAGLSQEQFGELLSLSAAEKVAEIAAVKQGFEAEKTKLGAAASLRVTAIQQFFKGHLGDELAKSMNSALITAKNVEGWEKLMRIMAGQNAGSFSSAHREPESTKVSDEQWNQMSYGERKEYAAAHSNGGNGRSRR